MVFTLRQEFEEESVVRSEKQLILDQDTLKFERMEDLRASLSGVDQDLFQQLFPGVLALPQPTTPIGLSSLHAASTGHSPQHVRPSGPVFSVPRVPDATPSVPPSPFPAAREPTGASLQPTEKRKASGVDIEEVATPKKPKLTIDNGEILEDNLDELQFPSDSGEDSSDSMNPDEQPSDDYADSQEPSSSSCSSEGHSS
jgi:hypothetical protein